MNAPEPIAGPRIQACALAGVGVRRGTHWALRQVDLALAAGAMTALVGPNGAGKSTLLELLAGVRRPTEGTLRWADPQASIAWLPQQPALDTSLPVSVLDTVLMGHWPRVGAFGRLKATHREEALQALQRVGLAGLGSRRIGELSTGQLQRLLFARLMLQRAAVVLMDEPFAAIDEATARDLLGLMRDWTRQGATVVFSSHDLAEVRAHADEAVLLAGGVAASGPAAAVLAAESLARARDWAFHHGLHEGCGHGHGHGHGHPLAPTAVATRP